MTVFNIWDPDSCACIVLCERPGKEGVFIERCKTHRKTLDTYSHNKSFNRNETDREIERQLPKYQRDESFKTQGVRP